MYKVGDEIFILGVEYEQTMGYLKNTVQTIIAFDKKSDSPGRNIMVKRDSTVDTRNHWYFNNSEVTPATNLVKLLFLGEKNV